MCEGLKEIGFVFEFISYLLLQGIVSLQETTEDGVVVGNMDQQWRVRALQTQQLCLKLHNREYNTVQSSKFKCIVNEWDLILWNLLLLLINFIIWCDINLFREIQENWAQMNINSLVLVIWYSLHLKVLLPDSP